MKLALLALLAGSVALAQDPPATATPPPTAPANTQPKPDAPVKPGPLPTEEYLAQEMSKLAQIQPGANAVTRETDWKIHWEFHVFALPAKKALALLPELRDEATIVAGWAKVQAMVEQGEADVVANNGGQVMNGVEVISSQGEDLRYGIEFDTPQLIESAELARRASEQPGPKKVVENAPVSFPTTTFETRRLGITLTMTARTSDDGKRLEVSTKFERIWFAQWDETEVGRLSNNEKIMIKQPRFVAVNNVGTSGLFAGERVLLSSHRVPGDGQKMELAFLRVWTTPRKAPAGK